MADLTSTIHPIPEGIEQTLIEASQIAITEMLADINE